MMANKNGKHKSGKSRRVIVLAVIAVVLLAGAAYLILKPRDVKDGEYFVNYKPPTKEEKAAGDKQKDITLKEEEARQDVEENSPTTQKKAATVIITDAAQYDGTVEVRAFIPDYYEDGVCKITFVQKDQVVEKSSPAYRDATTTICTNPMISRSEFPTTGTWDVYVTYESNGAAGRSEMRKVVIE